MKHYVIESDLAKDGYGIVTAEWYNKIEKTSVSVPKVVHEGTFESCFSQKRNILKSKPAVAAN